MLLKTVPHKEGLAYINIITKEIVRTCYSTFWDRKETEEELQEEGYILL